MGSFASKDRTSIRVVRVQETTLEVQGTRLSPKKKGVRQTTTTTTTSQSVTVGGGSKSAATDKKHKNEDKQKEEDTLNVKKHDRYGDIFSNLGRL